MWVDGLVLVLILTYNILVMMFSKTTSAYFCPGERGYSAGLDLTCWCVLVWQKYFVAEISFVSSRKVM